MNATFRLGFLMTALPLCVLSSPGRADDAAETTVDVAKSNPEIQQPRLPAGFDEITIIGDASDVSSTAGSAHVIDATKLEEFNYADIQRIVREIPGVSVQIENIKRLRGWKRTQELRVILGDVVILCALPK